LATGNILTAVALAQVVGYFEWESALTDFAQDAQNMVKYEAV
jgi:hypothetical protein